MKSPSKLKRVSKIMKNAATQNSNHYRFLKLDTIAFLVVYSIYGPTCGILRKTALHFYFFLKKKHFMAGIIIDILYIFWHQIDFRYCLMALRKRINNIFLLKKIKSIIYHIYVRKYVSFAKKIPFHPILGWNLPPN